MKCFAAAMLLAVMGVASASAPEPQQVFVQFSIGTGTTLVGFKVARSAAPADDDSVAATGRICLRLPLDCALVMESGAADGSTVVVRPQFGPIAFEVAVNRVRPTGSQTNVGARRSSLGRAVLNS